MISPDYVHIVGMTSPDYVYIFWTALAEEFIRRPWLTEDKKLTQEEEDTWKVIFQRMKSVRSSSETEILNIFMHVHVG